MTELLPYSGRAWNPATASENRIHADDVAQRYGFRGGLVPGVTVYALGVEPALRAWGREWLAHGSAEVTLRRPLYDGQDFRVEMVPGGDGDAVRATVVGPDATVCAELRVQRRSGGDPPVMRGDPQAPARDARPDATRSELERLREVGMGCIELVWDGRGEAGRYRLDAADMPELVRVDGDGFANPSFTLGLANWVLAANVRLGPWIHVESRVAHHDLLPLGTGTITEARVTDLFERRGHEFVDLDVGVFRSDGAPLLSAFHRAIYRLREPESPGG